METMLTVQELSKYTKMAPSTIYVLVARNEIPHFKVGSRILFQPSQIDEWLHGTCWKAPTGKAKTPPNDRRKDNG